MKENFLFLETNEEIKVFPFSVLETNEKVNGERKKNLPKEKSLERVIVLLLSLCHTHTHTHTRTSFTFFPVFKMMISIQSRNSFTNNNNQNDKYDVII